MRRLHGRLETLYGHSNRGGWTEALTLWSYGEMERLDAGGLDQLREWIGQHPDARLVIVDTLAKVRSGPQGKESSYEADYREVSSLKSLADETGVAIIVVTHTRKMAADDPFDTVSGTLGITGAADATMILTRDGQGVTLHVTGRDVAEIETALEWQKDICRWRALGDAADVRRSDERGELLSELFEANEDLTPTELASRLGKQANAIKVMLHRMAKAGEVGRGDKRGTYRHPDKATPQYPCNSRNPVTGTDGEGDE